MPDSQLQTEKQILTLGVSCGGIYDWNAQGISFCQNEFRKK